MNTSANTTINDMPPKITIKGIRKGFVGAKVDAVGVKVGDDPISLSFYFPVWIVIVIYLKNIQNLPIEHLVKLVFWNIEHGVVGWERLFRHPLRQAVIFW